MVMKLLAIAVCCCCTVTSKLTEWDKDRFFFTGIDNSGNMGNKNFGSGPMKLPDKISARLFEDGLQAAQVLGRVRSYMLLVDSCGGANKGTVSPDGGARYAVAWGANADGQLQHSATTNKVVRTLPQPTLIDFSAFLDADERIVGGDVGGYLRMPPWWGSHTHGPGHCEATTVLITTKGRAFSWGCNCYGQAGHYFNEAKNEPFEKWGTPTGLPDGETGLKAYGQTFQFDSIVGGVKLGWQGLHPWKNDRLPKKVYVAALENQPDKIAQVSVGRDLTILLTDTGRVFTAGRPDLVGRVDSANNEFRELHADARSQLVIKPDNPRDNGAWKGRFVELQATSDHGTPHPHNFRLGSISFWDKAGKQIPVLGGAFITQGCGCGWYRANLLTNDISQEYFRCTDYASLKDDVPHFHGLSGFIIDLGQEREIADIRVHCASSNMGCKDNFFFDVYSLPKSAAEGPSGYGYKAFDLNGKGYTSVNTTAAGFYDKLTWPNQLAQAPAPKQFTLAANEKIVQVSTGQGHSIMLSSTGRIFTFGNSPGALGRQGFTRLPGEVDLSNALHPGEKVIEIDAGYYYMLMRTDKDRILHFGRAIFEQPSKAVKSLNDQLLPAQIDIEPGALDGDSISRISAGFANAVLHTAKGRVLSIGSDRLGVLLQPNANFSRFGVMAFGDGAKVRSVSCAGESLCAQMENNEVVVLGSTREGVRGRISFMKTFTEDRDAEYSLYAKQDTHGLVKSISSYHHTLALFADGTLYSYGSNSLGQLGRDQSTKVADTKPGIVQVPNAAKDEKVKLAQTSMYGSYVVTTRERLLAFGWPQGTNKGPKTDATCGDARKQCSEYNDWDRAKLGLGVGETIIALEAGNAFIIMLTSRRRVLGLGLNAGGVLGGCGATDGVGIMLQANTNTDSTTGCWDTPVEHLLPDTLPGEHVRKIKVMSQGGLFLLTNKHRLFKVGKMGIFRSSDYSTAGAGKVKLLSPLGPNPTQEAAYHSQKLRKDEAIDDVIATSAASYFFTTTLHNKHYLYVGGWIHLGWTVAWRGRGKHHGQETGFPFRLGNQTDVGLDASRNERAVSVRSSNAGGITCVLTNLVRVLCSGSNDMGQSGRGDSTCGETCGSEEVDFDSNFLPTEVGPDTAKLPYLVLRGRTRPKLYKRDKNTPLGNPVYRTRPGGQIVLIVSINDVYNATAVHTRCIYGETPPFQVSRGKYVASPLGTHGEVECLQPAAVPPGGVSMAVALDPTGNDFRDFEPLAERMRTVEKVRFVVPFCKHRDRTLASTQFCHVCADGFIGVTEDGGYSRCSLCLHGFIASKPMECTICRPGFYCKNTYREDPCPPDMHCGRPGLDEPMKCAVGHYCPNGVDQIECPKSGLGTSHSCADGQLKISEGYWKVAGSVTRNTTFYQCPKKSACVTKATSSQVLCSAGSHGPLCALCKSGYAPGIDTACSKCPTEEESEAIVAVFILASLFVLLLVTAHVDVFAGGTAKNLITFLHGMSAFAAFNVPWSDTLMGMMRVLGPLANLEARSIAPIHCLGRTFSFYDAWGVALATPPLAAILVAVYTLALSAAGKLRRGSATVAEIVKKRIAFVCWLVYPGVTAMVLQFFNCNEVEGVSYLDRDYSLECYDSKWNALLPVSIVFLILYVVAIPVWFLSTHRKDGGNKAIAQLLAKPYKKGCPYTEEAIMIFKALLWVFAIFLGNTCLTQMIVVSFMCLVGTLAALHTKPFKHWVQNVLLELTLFTFTAMSLLGMVLQRNSNSSKCSNSDENTLQAVTTAIAICATIALGGATIVLVWQLYLRHLLKRPQVMISYRHVDSKFAQRLRRALEAAGFRVWIDTAIRAGNDWRDDIAQAIRDSVAVVFLTTPGAVTSKYCKEELFYARTCNKAIFPVMLEDTFSHLRGGVKVILQRIQWIDFSEEGAFDDKFYILKTRIREQMRQDRLANALQADDQEEQQDTEGGGGRDLLRTDSQLRMHHGTAGGDSGESADDLDPFDIFVCFARADKLLAERLTACLSVTSLTVKETQHQHLGAQAGGTGGEGAASEQDMALFDTHDKMLQASRLLVVVVSDSFATDEQCKEILHAAHEVDKPVLVVCRDPQAMHTLLTSGTASASVGLILSSYDTVVAYDENANVGWEQTSQEMRLLNGVSGLIMPPTNTAGGECGSSSAVPAAKLEDELATITMQSAPVKHGVA
eukprot:g397.t1